MAHNLSDEQQQIVTRLEEEGQQHVLRWLGELTDADRASFLKQLAGLNFDRLRELADLLNRPAEALSFADVEPAPVERLPVTDAERARETGVAEVGRKALADDRVAALTVAGGQGTRLKFDGPKGIYPITPVLKKSLFQFHAEKILAARRRYGCRMPWLIMTGPSNHTQTAEFFARQDSFGLGADSIHLFPQQTNPILDARGRLLLEEKGQLLVGPDGHGGLFEALARSGLLSLLEEAGLDLISCFQVDNPLVTVADERFLGHHIQKEAEFSCKVIPKRGPAEGLGVAVLRSGHPAIVEYVDLPRETASERTAGGELRYLYGSIAVHVINTAFARQVAEGTPPLPWHLARKQYDVINEAGEKAPCGPDGCFKFEGFVFDCLSQASGCAFVEVDRRSEFAPVKNAEGEDSPASARAMMRSTWIGWLREVGTDVTVFEDPATQIEIGPVFAASAEELRARLPAGWRPSPPVVLDR